MSALKKSLLAAVLAAVGVASFYLTPRGEAPARPELLQPRSAVAALRGSRIFFNPNARIFLLESQSDFLTPPDRDDRSERTLAFARASQNPQLWRTLDRREHFDSVLLCGDPAFYRALLQHLADSADWKLTFLDHTSFVFQRAPAAAWSPEQLKAVRKRLAALPPRQRADLLVQTANKLLSVKERAAAKNALDEALGLDQKSPAAWATLALYQLQLQKLADGLAATEKALALDKTFAPALEIKTQVLLAQRRAGEAFETSRTLVETAPKDANALRLHARAAHEARAFTSEISTLEKLIPMLQATGQSVSACRVYLGQAHAEKGEAAPALAQFGQALAADDLDPAQRKFVEETSARIKQRSGL